jgi:Skp family chaperone for outer membrane proteins
VNKSIATLAGGLILGAVALQALAQNNGRPAVQQTSGTQPGTPPAPGAAPVRVAVLNINKVLKNFNKAQHLNNHISGQVNAYGQQINAKREQIAKLQAEVQKPTTDPAQAEQMRRQAVQLEREMQDLDAEARKNVSAQQGTIAVGIYKDIEGVVQRVAAANGFDLVMSYPDATTEADMYSQPNVVRKLASQAAIPLFYRPHIDLTDAVIQTLNATYPVAAPTPGATAPNAAPPSAPPAVQPNLQPGAQPQRKQ